jgi:outer membrane protein assembly factor BamA
MSDRRTPAFWRRAFRLFLFIPIGLVLSTSGSAQETRTGEIERQRDEKANHTHYDEPGKTEKTLMYIEDSKLLERLSSGFRGWNLRFGGLVQGSGFALGPEYSLRSDFEGKSTFQVGAQFSTKLYQKYYSRWTLPKLAHDRLSLDLNAVHRNYSQIDYFGPGPRSLEGNRTDYRLEDTAVDGSLAARPNKHLQLGGAGGYLWVNVGPGASSQLPSTDQVFPPSILPGIDHQTNFWRYGPFAQVDYLDNTEMPASGGLYTFQYTWYRDQRLNLHDFQRIDAEIQQYFGFFNKTRVLALRAKTTLTDADHGNTVPFYMQSTIGGSEDLRGFRPFRFYDNNSFVLNAEYRFHAMGILDMALFADGGKVFPRRGQLNFRDLQGDGGVGFRFNIRGHPFMRVDLAASHEGFQIWLKFNDIFVRHPVGTASAQPIL